MNPRFDLPQREIQASCVLWVTMVLVPPEAPRLQWNVSVLGKGTAGSLCLRGWGWGRDSVTRTDGVQAAFSQQLKWLLICHTARLAARDASGGTAAVFVSREATYAALTQFLPFLPAFSNLVD